MSLVPEYIIQQVLVRGLRAFRENEDLVRMLFRNLEQKDIEEIVLFFRNKAIDICINYPDKDLTIPMIVILLGSEAETDPLLGELQQAAESFREEAPLPQESLQGDQTVLGGGSISTVGGPAAQGDLLLAPTTATGGTSNTITAPAGTTILIDPYDYNEAFVEILEGTGSGQRRQVESITPSLSGGPVIIEVTEIWTTTPDATSIFKIIGPRKEHGTGEPPKLFTAGDNIERKGQIYEARYRLDIIAHPQELAIYLYNVVKAIFTINHQLLLTQGFLYFSMGGTDLGPLPDFYPQLAYRRTMNLSFKYAFDVLTEMSQEVADQLVLALSVHDPDVGDDEDVERVTIETSFNVS